MTARSQRKAADEETFKSRLPSRDGEELRMQGEPGAIRSRRHRLWRAIVVACLASLAPWVVTIAHAEPGFPSRPVRIMVPYGPGGVADVTMRLLAQKLGERLGQQFVIDNRPSAGGIIAAKATATAAPDGYTLVVSGNGMAIAKSLFKSLPYDVLTDFTPVSITAFLDLMLATRADGRLKSVNDIIAAAKADPGKLNFGTIAPGSTQNLSAELFRMTADIKVTIVTYRTTPDLLTALLRGDVDVGFDYYAGFNAALKDNKLRAVASTGDKRAPWTPEVPTVKESGLAGYAVVSWNALSGPAGMPRDVVDLLNREINAALRLPDVQEKAHLFGLDARGTTPEEMAQRMASDVAKWAAVIEKVGLERQ
jgi:tripartite-type tricarboxylate transporter receptor subunit TctC